MTMRIGLLPFVIFCCSRAPAQDFSRGRQHRDQPHLGLSPVLFPPPVAQGICGLSRLQGSNKNEVGKPASLLLRLAKPTLPQHLGYKSTQPLWNRKGTKARDRGQRCGKTRCVTRMTAK